MGETKKDVNSFFEDHEDSITELQTGLIEIIRRPSFLPCQLRLGGALFLVIKEIFRLFPDREMARDFTLERVKEIIDRLIKKDWEEKND